MGISWLNNSSFFTTVPRLLSYITSTATESYNSNTSGGSNL